MNRILLSILLLFCITSSVVSAQTPDPAQINTWVKEAKKIIKRLNHQLKATRKHGLSEGGETKAVEACHLDAPDIAKALSESSQWSVRRTTLKTRGLDNAPDKWEISGLNKFEERQKRGVLKEQPEFFEITKNKDGRKVFRYMKAIFIKRSCLKCHGKHINSDVASQLASLYPFDLATGYKKGDLRGAYTLSLLIDNKTNQCESPAYKQKDTCWRPLSEYQVCSVNTEKRKENPKLTFCPENKTSHIDTLKGYEFISVEDGDTIVINYKGKHQRVQLIGIDAPENTVNPKLNLDASRKKIGISYLLQMGYLATEHLKKQLKNQAKVFLDGDLDKKDKYGRLPAIVINDKGESLNQTMVADGYALLLTRFPISEKLRNELAKAQKKAQENNKGLWGSHSELMQKWSQ